MKKSSRMFHIDDALFVLALLMPSLIALARYVETAAQTSTVVLARQQHRTQVVGTSHEKPVAIVIALAGEARR